QHDDVGIDAALANRLAEREAVHDWHLPIRDDDGIPALSQVPERVFAVTCLLHFEYGTHKAIGDELELQLIVIDEQESRRQSARQSGHPSRYRFRLHRVSLVLVSCAVSEMRIECASPHGERVSAVPGPEDEGKP